MDVKRLAASLEIAGRDNAFTRKQRRAVVVTATRGYRLAMRDFATQPNLAVWYAQLDVDREMSRMAPDLKPSAVRKTEGMLTKARTHDSMQAFAKLAVVVDGQPRIVSDPPLVVPVSELLSAESAERLFAQQRALLAGYRRTLQSDRRHHLGEYRLVDIAHKVVGVGSVDTQTWILLMEGVDERDPLFLQAKQAQTSVLEPYAGASAYANHGERVVAGQRLMQATSDIFLGWQRSTAPDGITRDFYVRQLRDWKGSVRPEQMTPTQMTVYARLCGCTLARAHARSGDRLAIAAYLGSKDTFEQAIADFAAAYAGHNDQDYAALRAAAAAGRIRAQGGL